MPNLQGGKKYKSSKHSNDVKAELHEIGEGQMVGRVVRSLGNRRMLVYCNDGKQRICKIRGKLRKKVAFITVGDIILLSLREEMADGSSSVDVSGERGDILAKYDPTLFSKLKKEDGINPKLFLTIETMESSVANSKLLGESAAADDDYFDSGSDDEDEEEDNALKTKTIPSQRNRDKRTAIGEDGEVNIDAI